MRKWILPLLLVLGCRSVPERVDTVLDVPPNTAGAAAYLGASLGLSRPIVVEEAPLLQVGFYGQAHWLGDYYLIRLDETLDRDAQVMVLIHELAHLVVWERGWDEDGHSEDWGRAYAEVFRIWAREDPDSSQVGLDPEP